MAIYPGELGREAEIIANGGDVDGVGASAVELIGPGESAVTTCLIVIQNGEITTAKYR